MRNPTTTKRVQRVAVTDPYVATVAHDYADAFEVRLATPDPYTPREWVEAGFGAMPSWADALLGLFGVQDSPPAPGRLGPLDIVTSRPDVIHLATSIPLMDVTIVGRNVEDTRRTFTTTVTFRSPLARIAFALIGIGHRWNARRVVSAMPARGAVAKQA